MKILVAIDSFKGSASSKELNLTCKEAIESVISKAKVITFSIADGGEGTIDALSEHIKSERVEIETIDLMGKKIKTYYLISERKAFIESAKVIGLDRIIPSVETVSKATTFGLGTLVKDAIDKECTEIYMSLGGSGTSDGGIGFLESMGFDKDSCQFNHQFIKKGISIIAIADVTNPYAGEQGYANVFGPQKGANRKQVEEMNSNSLAFSKRVNETIGVNLQSIPGTGAAGGLGGAITILGGKIQPGFETISSLIKLEESIKDADLVITGEGKLDGQSQGGKVPVAISQMAKKYGVPSIAICGSLEDDPKLEEIFLGTFSIQREFLSLEEALDNQKTKENVSSIIKSIMKVITVNGL
ncbi:glycerate kinase family protein [Streptococcus parauberis]|uniref:glycerate kinase family protein n=1 Tax=Streptococcus parauberis TaxID=1348 RepID=UPI000C1CA96E|nr:glycerate kinase [Streptococcus parauberis]PIO79408.1 Glycerate kinase [Streptococcus parauberis]POS67538.1 Glycerate kinase [Streptococcus parauberis]